MWFKGQWHSLTVRVRIYSMQAAFGNWNWEQEYLSNVLLWECSYIQQHTAINFSRTNTLDKYSYSQLQLPETALQLYVWPRPMSAFVMKYNKWVLLLMNKHLNNGIYLKNMGTIRVDTLNFIASHIAIWQLRINIVNVLLEELRWDCCQMYLS